MQRTAVTTNILVPVRKTSIRFLNRRILRSTALVTATEEGYGTKTPEARRQKGVTILDVFEGAASVKIVAADWIDYLHLAKEDDDWQIVNVLWEMKPKRGQSDR